jgi:hypothetical protein
MNIKASKKLTDKHFVEWGDSTWDEDDFSIRNRKNRDDGGFNHSASSEIPWYDFIEMIHSSIEKEQFSKNELRDIIQKIINTNII